MTSRASVLFAARLLPGATVLETTGTIVIVIPTNPASDGLPTDLLTLPTAAGLAATSVRVLRNAIRAGELAATGRQRDRAVRRGDLEKWIEGRRVGVSVRTSDEFEAGVERILARKKTPYVPDRTE